MPDFIIQGPQPRIQNLDHTRIQRQQPSFHPEILPSIAFHHGLSGQNKKWTWLLAGGGAKGSFQVGALIYLSGLRVEPLAVVGTSVGAINAILASVGTQDAVRRLRDVWLGLENESDMYVVTPEADRLERSLLAGAMGLSLSSVSSMVLTEPPSGIDTVDPRVAPKIARRKYIKLVSRTMRFGASPLAGLALMARVSRQVERFRRLLEDTLSLYNLTPIIEKMNQIIDIDELNRSNIHLRMVCVALETGNPCFVDKQGRFAEIYDSAPGPIYRNLGGDQQTNIITGAIASAAIPGAFPPIVFNTNDPDRPPPVRTCVDGGVRDVLPSREALDLVGEQAHDLSSAGVIAIHNSNPLGFKFAGIHLNTLFNDLGLPNPFLEKDPVSYSNMIEVAVRSISIASSEVNRTDLLEPILQRGEVEKILIFPDYQITGTAQIDPGLVRINMSYGWMIAFETLRRAIIGPNWPELRRNTNEIIMLRLASWVEETRFADFKDIDVNDLIRELRLSGILGGGEILGGLIDTGGVIHEDLEHTLREFGFDSVADAEDYFTNLPRNIVSSVRRIRRLKRAVFDSVRFRIETWGQESLPSVEDLNSSFSNWWLEFERHQPDSDPINFGMRTPWVSGLGTSLFGRDIPRVEAEVPPGV